MSAIIQTKQLTKSYGRSRGILDVTFDIQEGEVFGFLGPNGATNIATHEPTLEEVFLRFYEPQQEPSALAG